MRRLAIPWVGAMALIALVGCGGRGGHASAAGGDDSAAGGDVSAAGGSATGVAAEATGNSGSVDACRLVTGADATALFGRPASSQKPEMAPLPDQIGVCQWGWVGAERTQQLSLTIMSDPGDHYVAIEGARPLDLGEKSQLVIDETTLSMDIDWVQNGEFLHLHYTAAPYNAFDKSEAGPLQSLAREISGRF